MIKNLVYQSLHDLKFTPTLNWPQICNTINEFPKEHIEIIYALILHHYFVEMSKKSIYLENDSKMLEMLHKPVPKRTITSKSKALQLPFGGKTFENGKGAIYTVDKIPAQLRHIISAYVHLATVK